MIMGFIFESVQVLICVLEVYLVFDFFSTFFGLRCRFAGRYTQAALIPAIAAGVYGINTFNNATVNIISMFMNYLAVILIFFQGKLFKKFLYYITAMIIMAGGDFLFVVMMSLQTDFAMSKIESDIVKFTALVIGVKLFTLILFNIAKKISKDAGDDRIDFKITLLYSVLSIALIGIMISIARLNVDFSSAKTTQLLLLFSCVLALLGSVIVFYVFNRYARSIWQLQQQELVILRMEMEEKHYREIEQVNEEHAAFWHDVRHYMKVIGEMASEGQNEEILQILSKLQIEVSDTMSAVYCANHLLNTILNEKKKEAERKNIGVKILVEPDFTIDRVTDADLIILMSNLLDNAIEAAGKCAQGSVAVYLFMNNGGHFSTIKIVNNYTGEIRSEGDRLFTSKEDTVRHGFGMRNADDAAAKYGGRVRYTYQDGKFMSVVVIPAA